MVRVGQIGMGFMGRTHFGIYEKLRDAKVVALCDIDAKRRAGSWAGSIGNLSADWPEQVDMKDRKSFASLEEMLADPDIDMIDITLPTYLHAEAVIKTLQAGKHVLSEKPMGLSSAECKKVLAAYAKSKSHYMVAQCIRFWPQYVTIKDMIQSKKLGKLRSLSLKRLSGPPMYSSRDWLMDHTKSGGAHLDLHVHDVDYANFLLGKPNAIYAKGTTGPSKGIDHIEATWDYGKDLIVSIEGGWAFPSKWPFEMAIIARCEKGTLKWFMSEGSNIKLYTDAGVKILDPYGKQLKDGQAGSGAPNGWQEEIKYFVNKVNSGKKGKENICSPESTALSIALAEAEAKSVQTGKVIPVK